MGTLLAGRRALITGASRGIGAAIARCFADEGAEIGLVARDEASLASLAEELRDQGASCSTYAADLAVADGIRTLAQACLAEGKPWTILINNAGVAHQTALLAETEEAWDALMRVNVRAPMMLAQALVPGMIACGGGKIVNISSVAAFQGTPGFGAYASSKAALNQLTRTMAVEWGPHNIQVNAVCPTIILTDMGRALWDKPEMAEARRAKQNRIPAHRFGTPEEVAQAVLYLVGPGANFVNGVALPIDGGMLVSP